jgi:ABC-type transporter Mla subunit MlaD
MAPVHAKIGSGEDRVKGLKFERLPHGQYYKVVLHIGSTYVPVADDTLADLKSHSLLPAERFLELLVEKVGYSSYLKEQLRAELKSTGDPITQVTVLQGVIRDL